MGFLIYFLALPSRPPPPSPASSNELLSTPLPKKKKEKGGKWRLLNAGVSLVCGGIFRGRDEKGRQSLRSFLLPPPSSVL